MSFARASVVGAGLPPKPFWGLRRGARTELTSPSHAAGPWGAGRPRALTALGATHSVIHRRDGDEQGQTVKASRPAARHLGSALHHDRAGARKGKALPSRGETAALAKPLVGWGQCRIVPPGPRPRCALSRKRAWGRRGFPPIDRPGPRERSGRGHPPDDLGPAPAARAGPEPALPWGRGTRAHRPPPGRPTWTETPSDDGVPAGHIGLLHPHLLDARFFASFSTSPTAVRRPPSAAKEEPQERSENATPHQAHVAARTASAQGSTKAAPYRLLSPTHRQPPTKRLIRKPNLL